MSDQGGGRGRENAPGQQPDRERGSSATAHERRDARRAYKTQWEADNPGQEFPGFPPELEGMGKGGEDDDDTEPEV